MSIFCPNTSAGIVFITATSNGNKPSLSFALSERENPIGQKKITRTVYDEFCIRIGFRQ